MIYTRAHAIFSLVPDADCVDYGDHVLWKNYDQPPVTEEQINAEVARLQALEPNKQRVSELKQMLADTDYKVLPDYDNTTDEIKAQRQAWRDEIRTLEQP